jgi:hypothetical protein
LFNESESGGYSWVFGDGKEVWTTVPEAEFRLRSAIWWLSRAFGDQMRIDKKHSSDTQEKAALERKWLILFVARLVLERSYGGDSYKQELAKTYKGDWEFRRGPVGEWFGNLYDVAKEVLVWNYKQAAKTSHFTHRNWVRDSSTVAALQNYVADAPIRFAKKA